MSPACPGGRGPRRPRPKDRPDAATAHQPQPQRPSLLFGNLYTVVSDSCTWWPRLIFRRPGKRQWVACAGSQGPETQKGGRHGARDGAPLRAAYGRSAGWRPGCAGRRLSEASADLTGGSRVRGDTQNEDPPSAPRVWLNPVAVWELLDQLDISQNQMARWAGISPGHLSLLMNAKRSPAPGVRRRLMKALGVDDFHRRLYWPLRLWPDQPRRKNQCTSSSTLC